MAHYLYICPLTLSSDPFEYYMFFFALSLISQKVQKGHLCMWLVQTPQGREGRGHGCPCNASAHSTNNSFGFLANAYVPPCSYFRLCLFHPGGQVPVVVPAH